MLRLLSYRKYQADTLYQQIDFFQYFNNSELETERYVEASAQQVAVDIAVPLKNNCY